MAESPLIVAIMGVTASGKTALAEELADRIDAQLLNADAFQVYRGLDIGTAKPENRERYRLLDILDPSEAFGVGRYVALAAQALTNLYALGRNVVVVGGTGLYIRALLEQYNQMAGAPDPQLRAELSSLDLNGLVERLVRLDPAQAVAIDLRNPARVRRALERLLSPPTRLQFRIPPFKRFKFAIERTKEETEARIAVRVASMVDNGWVQEVRHLRDEGRSLDDPGMRAIGYRHIWDVIEGKIALEAALQACIVDTRRYAKRQRTWLNTEPSLIRVEPDVAIDQVLRNLNLI